MGRYYFQFGWLLIMGIRMFSFGFVTGHFVVNKKKRKLLNARDFWEFIVEIKVVILTGMLFLNDRY